MGTRDIMATRSPDRTGAALAVVLAGISVAAISVAAIAVVVAVATSPALAQQGAAAAAQPPASSAQPAAKTPPKSAKKAAAKEQAAKPQQDPAAARSLAESGIAAVQTGKLDQGITQLSSALSGGGLASQDMARALYFRGAAYRKQSKPALAISDLTSALWLKNGLKDGDRQDAQAQRSAAYREAGLPDQTPAGATAAEPRSIIAAAPTTPKAAGTTSSAAAPAAAASAPSISPSTSALTPTERRAAEVAGVRTESPRAAAAPPDAPTAAAAASGGGVGGFLGSLFGGSSAAQKPVETASTPPPSPPQSSSWSTTTNDKSPAAAKSAGKAKAASAATPATAAPAAPGGKFLLQVASARSRPEAEAVAQKLRQQLGADLGRHSTEISEASFGGTAYYRVKLGTFASSEEPRALCGKLRQQGFDCLIVTQ